jgi:DNA-binding MarR family transcriptional regulator
VNLENLILDRRIGLRALRTLVALQRLADADGLCTATQTEIAGLAGMGWQKISASTDRLAALGLIEKSRRVDGRRRRCRYRLIKGGAL